MKSAMVLESGKPLVFVNSEISSEIPENYILIKMEACG